MVCVVVQVQFYCQLVLGCSLEQFIFVLPCKSAKEFYIYICCKFFGTVAKWMNGSLQWKHPLDAERIRTQVVREESERKRAAHKQGLQRALASINQLRKEREEFAYPPASVRARRGARGGGS